MDKKELDMTLFTIDALLSNEKLHKDINKIYEKNKYKAYKLAKDTVYYNNDYMNMHTIEKLILSRRILGLIALDHEENTNNIISLLEKGWGNIAFLIRNKKEVDLSEIVQKYKYMDSIIVGTVVLLLVYYYKKEVMQNENTMFFIEQIQALSNHHIKHFKKFTFDKLTKEKKNIAKKIRTRIFEKYGVIKNLDDINVLICEHCLPEVLEKVLYYKQILIEKFLLLDDLMNIDIAVKEIDELCYLYFLIYKNQNAEQAFLYVAENLYFNTLGGDLKNTKQYFVKNNKETLYLNIEELELKNKEYEAENMNLENENKRLTIENNRLENSYKENIERENIELKNEIEKLKSIIDQQKEDMTELYELREQVFQESIEDVGHSEEKKVELPDANVLIVGGVKTWRDKLKVELPESFKVVNGKNENIDVSIVSNTDLILFNTIGMNHTTFYKIRNEAIKKNTKYKYLKNKTNIGFVKEEIYNILKR